MDINVDEIRNGINKETGRSCEIAISEDGHAHICDYDGNISEEFNSIEDAKSRYLVF